MASQRRKTNVGFTLPEEDARQIHRAAAKLGITASSLLRSIVYNGTNGLTTFELLIDPHPGNRKGRPIKRFEVKNG